MADIPETGLTVEMLEPGRLKPYAGNARTHSAEQVAQIADSMREFGFTNPILVDGDDGVIAGHGRLLAAVQLGLARVPCVRLGHLSDAQRRALVIADNRLALSAGWNLDVLALELTQLSADGFDLGLTGFDVEEIGALLHRFDGSEGLTDVDDAPALQERVVSRAGDVWVLGAHRVVCGDSGDLDVLQALMGDEAADLWLTDPPYNVAYKGGATGKRRAIENDEMADDQFRAFLVRAYSGAAAHLRAGAVFYIWHADGPPSSIFRFACGDVGWRIRQCLIWVKSSATMGRQDFQWAHEPCVTGWTPGEDGVYEPEHLPCLYGWQEGAGHAWNNDRRQTTVLQFDKPARSSEHPTMKPVAMFEYLVRNSTRPGEVVLDSFGGSGTTLIACEHSGRAARLAELDPRYVDVIVRRWQAFTGHKAVRDGDGVAFDDAASVATEVVSNG